MRKLQNAVAPLLLCFVLSAQALAQTSNATLGRTVADVSGALIPGVTITAANTQTCIVTTVVDNEAGAYQLASVQTGIYRVGAEVPGFQTQTYSDVVSGVNARVNFRSNANRRLPSHFKFVG